MGLAISLLAGMNSPPMMKPPGGTSRHNGEPRGGLVRGSSSIQARRYLQEVNLVPARISEVSFFVAV